MHLIDTLQQRGFIHQMTNEAELRAHLDVPGRLIYCGFGPTANSLQMGNAVPIMMLMHAQLSGHTPVVVQGGFTGLIGDPSGKSAERTLLDPETVAANVNAQRTIFDSYLDFDSANGLLPARLFDNNEWLGRLSAMDLLRDFGKLCSVNQMLQRDNVRVRLERPDQGISYTEFSYGLLQAIDFAHLYRAHGVTVQIGGSDQWGNIIGGIDFVRRLEGAAAFGITAPLVTRADGQKFGKTEAGSVWLSAGRTSPFAYSQFWLNTADADVGKYLRLFTLLDIDEIADLENRTTAEPQARHAQRALALHATGLLHGLDAANRCLTIGDAVFGGDPRDLSLEQLIELAGDLPVTRIELPDGVSGRISVIDVLQQAGVATSRRDARALLEAGSIRINGCIAEPITTLERSMLLHRRFALISKGKRSRHLIDLD
jgi:tyrosyl-tRNA synthetase